MFSIISVRMLTCHRISGSIRNYFSSSATPKRTFSPTIASFFPSSSRDAKCFYSNGDSAVFFRNIASSSKADGDHHVGAKHLNLSKRGPKFRTPSKMKDASATLGVKEAFGEERQKPRPDWNIWAYATAEEYQMEQLGRCFKNESSYEVNVVAQDLPDVFRLTPTSKTDAELDRREIFVFR